MVSIVGCSSLERSVGSEVGQICAVWSDMMFDAGSRKYV